MTDRSEPTFEERFLGALNDFINNQTRPDGGAVTSERVTGYDTETVFEGYCETCQWERTVIEIYYVEKGTGRGRTYTYDDDFAALMREL